MQYPALTDLRREVSDFLLKAQPGVQVFNVLHQDLDARMALEVAEGLEARRRMLPYAYFYDPYGAMLFESITALPEYYQTRAEAAILAELAPELATLCEGGPLVELGSGSSAKTRTLLDAWQRDEKPLLYVPVDINETGLLEAAEDLTGQYNRLQVLGLAGFYEEALHLLPDMQNKLFLFLGGSIGNFTVAFQHVFFRNLMQSMGQGSRLLLGFDRRPHGRKPVERIISAYNDRQRVTEAFNLNMLSHINQRLEANFDVSRWTHRAIYNEAAHQIEMYLESDCFQTVYVRALGREFVFEQGECILTEISRKFDPTELAAWFERLGYCCLRQWSDPEENFGMMLLEV